MNASHGLTHDECAERLKQVDAKIANLVIAMRSNWAIAVSLGIIIERMTLSEDQAFEFLRDVSRRRHLKMRELANAIVFSGEIPEPSPTRGSNRGPR